MTVLAFECKISITESGLCVACERHGCIDSEHDNLMPGLTTLCNLVKGSGVSHRVVGKANEREHH